MEKILNFFESSNFKCTIVENELKISHFQTLPKKTYDTILLCKLDGDLEKDSAKILAVLSYIYPIMVFEKCKVDPKYMSEIMIFTGNSKCNREEIVPSRIILFSPGGVKSFHYPFPSNQICE